jgi:hypothetical protein
MRRQADPTLARLEPAVGRHLPEMRNSRTTRFIAIIDEPAQSEFGDPNLQYWVSFRIGDKPGITPFPDPGAFANTFLS